jgi:putative spermidine/putrescine transport system permease protein
MTTMKDTRPLWRAMRLLICLLVAIYMLVPLAIVLITSFSAAPFLAFPPPGLSLRWYSAIFANPIWLNAFSVSVQILIPTALVSTALGTAAAYALVRQPIPGASLISGILMLPIVVPVIITGAAMFSAFRGFGLLGTISGLIIAHIVLTLPYVLASITAALKVVDVRLEQAALTLGASHWAVFRRITLPLILPSVLSSMLFAMVISFDELVVSLFLSSARVKPVTVQIWSSIVGEGDPTITAVAAPLFVFSLVVLMVDSFIRRPDRADSMEA